MALDLGVCTQVRFLADGRYASSVQLHVRGVVTEEWVLRKNRTFLHELFGAVTDVITDLTIVAQLPRPGIWFTVGKAEARFPQLRTIHGTLHVAWADSGYVNMPNLRVIKRSLHFGDNPGIPDFGGLAKLERIGGSLHVRDNAQLRNLEGLENLREIGGSVALFRNAKLRSLAGLKSLATLGGDFFLGSGQPLLTSCRGLEALGGVGGSVSLYRTDLRYMYGLEGVRYVGGNLTLQDNRNLVGLRGLDDLAHIAGSLELYDQDALQTMQGLGALAAIGQDLVVLYHKGLVSFVGMERLRSIGGNLILTSIVFLGPSGEAGHILMHKGARTCELNEPVPRDECTLAAVDVLPQDTRFSGEMNSGTWPTSHVPSGCSFDTENWSLHYNSNDTVCPERICGGHLDFESMHYSPVCRPATRVRACTWGLAGLETLQRVGGSVLFAELDYLQNFRGLEGLATIGGNLWVRGCPQLQSISALSNLAAVHGDLSQDSIHVHPPPAGPDGHHGEGVYQTRRNQVNFTRERLLSHTAVSIAVNKEQFQLPLRLGHLATIGNWTVEESGCGAGEYVHLASRLIQLDTVENAITTTPDVYDLPSGEAHGAATPCRACPAGRFQAEHSHYHEECAQATACANGFVEGAAATATSDRTCEVQSTRACRAWEMSIQGGASCEPAMWLDFSGCLDTDMGRVEAAINALAPKVGFGVKNWTTRPLDAFRTHRPEQVSIERKTGGACTVLPLLGGALKDLTERTSDLMFQQSEFVSGELLYGQSLYVRHNVDRVSAKVTYRDEDEDGDIFDLELFVGEGCVTPVTVEANIGNRPVRFAAKGLSVRNITAESVAHGRRLHNHKSVPAAATSATASGTLANGGHTGAAGTTVAHAPSSALCRHMLISVAGVSPLQLAHIGYLPHEPQFSLRWTDAPDKSLIAAPPTITCPPKINLRLNRGAFKLFRRLSVRPRVASPGGGHSDSMHESTLWSGVDESGHPNGEPIGSVHASDRYNITRIDLVMGGSVQAHNVARFNDDSREVVVFRATNMLGLQCECATEVSAMVSCWFARSLKHPFSVVTSCTPCEKVYGNANIPLMFVSLAVSLDPCPSTQTTMPQYEMAANPVCWYASFGHQITTFTTTSAWDPASIEVGGEGRSLCVSHVDSHANTTELGGASGNVVYYLGNDYKVQSPSTNLSSMFEGADNSSGIQFRLQLTTRGAVQARSSGLVSSLANQTGSGTTPKWGYSMILCWPHERKCGRGPSRH